MSTRFLVIAAMVDTSNLSLYKQDGSVVTIPQGDARLQPILDKCLAALKKEGDTVEIDISENNYYADYEKKTGGLTKFFRVAKSKVAEFFGKTEAVAEPVKPIVLGKVPGRGTPTVTAVVSKKAEFVPTAEAKLASAVDEILSHAVPVTHESFSEPEKMPEAKKYQTVPDTHTGDTIIAVTNGQVIPGVEQIKPQIAAASMGNSKGLDAFMDRISKVIGKRRHSVEDLLKFLEKGDLPIADDGCIVAYKRLNRKTGKVCVDVHSGNVLQQVGSFVHMDETMVDANRAQDCSHGLHIARRGYLGGFSGNVTVICKIKPEDVIAVPQYDANKVRVCAYHIVAELTDEQARKVIANKAMTDDNDAQVLLGKILAGDHVGITEYVKIGGPKGTQLTITPANEASPVAKKVEKVMEQPRKAIALSNEKVEAPAVDVKAVAQKVTANKEKEKGVHKASLKEQAACYMEHILRAGVDGKQSAAAELVKLKKSSKKSWSALGIAEDQVEKILNIAKDALPQKGAIFTDEKTVAKAETQVAKAKAKPVVERKVRSDKGSKVAHESVVDVAAPEAAVTTKTNKFMTKPADVAAGFPKKKPRNDDHMLTKSKPAAPTKVNKQETLQDLLRKVQAGDHAAAADLRALQKAKKKGWQALGLPSDAGEQIEKLIGKPVK